MNKVNILVTGGAGFIGSNLVRALLNDSRVNIVRVLDNLSTGFRHNLYEFEKKPNFEFVEGDITNYKTCLEAMNNIHIISHQAALGSVPRSIEDPIKTNLNNVTGTLNIFTAAWKKNIRRIVYAASSSTYGDSQALPKREEIIGAPISPYAVTKLTNELYAKVFADLYEMELIGLRYFNVFGPQQDPNGAYAAVIPLFNKALIEGKRPKINGDGEQSRDFTYIDNVLIINVLALFSENKNAINQIYNVACGEATTINEMWKILSKIGKSNIDPIYGPNRKGDVRASLADISKARKLLNYQPQILIKEGLEKTYIWYEQIINKK